MSCLLPRLPARVRPSVRSSFVPTNYKCLPSFSSSWQWQRRETFVEPRPTFYTHRWGQSKRVLHGMFTRAWQFEQVDNFLWCDNLVSLSEEMEKCLWTAKTREGGEAKQGRQEKGRPSRPLLGHRPARPAGMPVEPIETRIDKTSGECDHREIALSASVFLGPMSLT